MACAEYQEKLIEAALDPESEMAREAGLVRHVDGCAACRAELEQQRALYARIEDGIEALVNVSVPNAIAARVRQEIAAQPSRSFTWGNFGWIGAVAVAAAAILIALMFRPTIAPQQPPAIQTSSHPAEVMPLAVSPNRVAVVAPPKESPSRNLAPARIRVTTHEERPQLLEVAVAAQIGPPRVQVIVPAGQREAVLRLAAALQSGRVDVASILALAPQSLQPVDLQIAPLEVKPLVSNEADNGGNLPDTKPSIRN